MPTMFLSYKAPLKGVSSSEKSGEEGVANEGAHIWWTAIWKLYLRHKLFPAFLTTLTSHTSTIVN